MTNKFSLLYVAIVMMISVACNNAKKADRQSDCLVFDCVKLDTIASYSKDAGSPKCSIDINLFYAKGPNAHIINDKILKSGIFLVDELKRGEKKTVPKAVDIVVKNHIKSFKNTCKGFMEDNIDLEALSACYFNVTSQYSYGRDSIINYVAGYQSYMGGAHGWYNSFALNFDPKTGKLLQLSDILVPGSDSKLTDMIVAQIAKDNGYSTLDELRDNEGVFGILDPYIPENFVLDTDSVMFFYQCEEIGPYAVGEIATKFSYNDLQGIIQIKK